MRARTRGFRHDDGRRGERGQSLVELAIVTPLLMLLLMGTVDVGRIIFTYIALEDAVQEGSIYLAHNPTEYATVDDWVTTSSDHTEVVNATVTAFSPCSTAATTDDADSIWVQATYSLPMLTPGASQIFGSGVSLTAKFIGTNFKGDCTP